MVINVKNLVFWLLVGWQVSPLHAIEQCAMMIFGTRGWSIRANMTYESSDDVVRAIRAYVATQYHVMGRPILEKQRYGLTPSSWIQLNLTGWGQDYTEVVIRNDNIYALGLKTRGQSLAMKGHSGLMQGSTPLSFGASYSDLFSVETQGYLELPTLILGRESLLQAIRTSSNFDPADPTGEGDGKLKRVFAVFIVTFCEAARIPPIRARIRKYWPGPCQLNKMLARYTVYWGKISLRLLCWLYHYEWEGNDAQEMARTIFVKGPRRALEIVDLILWPKKFDLSDLDSSCIDPERFPYRRN